VAYSKLNAARVVSIYLGIGCAACMYMGLNLSSAGTSRCIFVLKGQFRINDILLCFRIVGNCVLAQRIIPKPLNLSVPSTHHGAFVSKFVNIFYCTKMRTLIYIGGKTSNIRME